MEKLIIRLLATITAVLALGGVIPARAALLCYGDIINETNYTLKLETTQGSSNVFPENGDYLPAATIAPGGTCSFKFSGGITLPPAVAFRYTVKDTGDISNVNFQVSGWAQTGPFVGTLGCRSYMNNVESPNGPFRIQAYWQRCGRYGTGDNPGPLFVVRRFYSG